MGKLPLLEKNAFLKIWFGYEGVRVNLAYSNYSNDQSYIVSDFHEYPKDVLHFTDDEVQIWIAELFIGIEEKFNWQIFRKDSKSKKNLPEMPFITENFRDEGEGVTAVSYTHLTLPTKRIV